MFIISNIIKIIFGTIIGKIFSILLIVILILLPGWISVFKGKTVSEGFTMIFTHFANTVNEAVKEALNYYKGWFGMQTEKAIDQGKQKAIENINNNINKK